MPPVGTEGPDEVQRPLDDAYARGIASMGQAGPRVGPAAWVDAIAHALTGGGHGGYGTLLGQGAGGKLGRQALRTLDPKVAQQLEASPSTFVMRSIDTLPSPELGFVQNRSEPLTKSLLNQLNARPGAASASAPAYDIYVRDPRMHGGPVMPSGSGLFNFSPSVILGHEGQHASGIAKLAPSTTEGFLRGGLHSQTLEKPGAHDMLLEGLARYPDLGVMYSLLRQGGKPPWLGFGELINELKNRLISVPGMPQSVRPTEQTLREAYAPTRHSPELEASITKYTKELFDILGRTREPLPVPGVTGRTPIASRPLRTLQNLLPYGPVGPNR